MAGLFAIKPLEQDSRTNNEIPRVLGALDLLLLGVGAIVGTGIFVFTGTVAAHHTGPGIVLAFAAAGFAAMLAGLCYAEIACMMPVAGSAYAYAYATLGEFAAWVIGWDLLLEYLLAAASVSVGWSAYGTAMLQHTVGVVLPPAWTSAPMAWDAAAGSLVRTGAYINAPAVLIVLLLTGVLTAGVRASARFNAATVFIKIAVILLFIGFATPHVQPAHWTPLIPENTGHFGAFGWSGLLQGASILFFCYNGFDAVSTAAQEVRRPERNLPIGILGSLAVAGILYMGVALVLTGMAPYTALGVAHPVSVGLEYGGLRWLQPIVELGAMAGLTSVILVNLFSQPRIAYAMACDGLLPARLGKLHPVHKTPHHSTLLAGGLCAAAGGLFPIDILGELMCVGTLFAFMVVSGGVLKLRRTAPHAPRRFRAPAGVPALATLACIGLLLASQLHSLVAFGAWLAMGFAVYALYGRRHSRLRANAAE